MTKKELGQHWLKQQTYIEQIVDAVELTQDDIVLEIGPGQGDMTRILAARVKKVVAVEFDNVLIEILSKSNLPENVEVISSDIRNFDLDILPAGYKVVANIPYYLTGDIIRKLLYSDNRPSEIVLLVQKEVAERVAAKPGKLSVLGIAAQLVADISLGIVVPAEAFIPPPKVDSQAIVFKLLDEPRIDVEPEKFLKLVKLAFSMKRKKLTNSLASVENSKHILSELGLTDARPQELDFKQWSALYNKIYA